MINLNSAHIFIILSLLSLATHVECRGRGGNYEEIKRRAIVRCPSTGQNNTEWQEMKECQEAATVLLFAPNGFPVEVNIKKKNAALNTAVMYGEQTPCWQQQHVAADCYLPLQGLLFVAICWDHWAQSAGACEARYRLKEWKRHTSATFHRYTTGVTAPKLCLSSVDVLKKKKNVYLYKYTQLKIHTSTEQKVEAGDEMVPLQFDKWWMNKLSSSSLEVLPVFSCWAAREEKTDHTFAFRPGTPGRAALPGIQLLLSRVTRRLRKWHQLAPR